jgi:release factor glutamine methyltransferase
MNQEEEWLLDEKYLGEKTEVREFLSDFIAFQNRSKFEKKSMKTSEVNTHSLSESELIFAEFCAMTMQSGNEQNIMRDHGEIVKEFLADCARLEAGTPLAYLIGHVPFLGTKISLTSRPLIPRPETEFWVEKIIDRIGAEKPDSRILDLCAGSGCIGVAILHTLPETQVDFAEIDSSHHSTIAENIKQNGINASRAHVFDGNLFENCTATYDYILSNPPYIDPALDRAEKSVREHEPHLALYGGTDGLELITRIITESVAHLTPHGVLVLEHEPEQVTSITSRAHEHGFDAESFPDQYGVIRYTVLTRREIENMAP